MQLLIYAALTAIFLVLVSKLFWVGLSFLAVWAAWEVFKRSDTYKQYDK